VTGGTHLLLHLSPQPLDLEQRRLIGFLTDHDRRLEHDYELDLLLLLRHLLEQVADNRDPAEQRNALLLAIQTVFHEPAITSMLPLRTSTTVSDLTDIKHRRVGLDLRARGARGKHVLADELGERWVDVQS